MGISHLKVENLLSHIVKLICQNLQLLMRLLELFNQLLLIGDFLPQLLNQLLSITNHHLFLRKQLLQLLKLLIQGLNLLILLLQLVPKLLNSRVLSLQLEVQALNLISQGLIDVDLGLKLLLKLVLSFLQDVIFVLLILNLCQEFFDLVLGLLEVFLALIVVVLVPLELVQILLLDLFLMFQSLNLLLKLLDFGLGWNVLGTQLLDDFVQVLNVVGLLLDFCSCLMKFYGDFLHLILDLFQGQLKLCQLLLVLLFHLILRLLQL